MQDHGRGDGFPPLWWQQHQRRQCWLCDGTLMKNHGESRGGKRIPCAAVVLASATEVLPLLSVILGAEIA